MGVSKPRTTRCCWRPQILRNCAKLCTNGCIITTLSADIPVWTTAPQARLLSSIMRLNETCLKMIARMSFAHFGPPDGQAKENGQRDAPCPSVGTHAALRLLSSRAVPSASVHRLYHLDKCLLVKCDRMVIRKSALKVVILHNKTEKIGTTFGVNSQSCVQLYSLAGKSLYQRSLVGAASRRPGSRHTAQ